MREPGFREEDGSGSQNPHAQIFGHRGLLDPVHRPHQGGLDIEPIGLLAQRADNPNPGDAALGHRQHAVVHGQARGHRGQAHQKAGKQEKGIVAQQIAIGEANTIGLGKRPPGNLPGAARL